jgi:hypothetical protein
MKKRILCVIVVCFIYSFPSYGQWQTDGLVICDTSANVSIDPLPRITTDGKGGAIVCWRDVRNPNYYNVYAQRVRSDGRIVWPHNGVPVALSNSNQDFPRICSDSTGGAYVAWENGQSFANIYAQRIDSNGQSLWQPQGIAVAEKGGLFISIANDQKGGLILGWNYGGVYYVVVQRLDGLGNRMWGDSGVQVTNRSNEVVGSNDVAIISDGIGGAIVAWGQGGRIYAQRVDSSGNICWQPNGVLLSDASKNAFGVAISSDKKGGAIANWNYSGGSGGVQRIRQSGQIVWQANGIQLVVSGSGGGQRNNSDGNGGAFIGSGLNIHHLDSLGNKLWGENGIAYYDTLGTTHSTQVCDGSQGILNFTEAFVNGEGFFIRAQWIDGRGTRRFKPDGIKMTPGLSTGSQMWPNAVTNGRGGAIVCWEDLLRHGYSTVWVGKIDTLGNLTNVKDESIIVPQSLKLDQNYPNPFNPETTISFSLSQRSFVKLIVYDLLGRKIKTLLEEDQSVGRHTLKFDSKDVGSGTYFYCLLANNKIITKKMLVLH